MDRNILEWMTMASHFSSPSFDFATCCKSCLGKTQPFRIAHRKHPGQHEFCQHFLGLEEATMLYALHYFMGRVIVLSKAQGMMHVIVF